MVNKDYCDYIKELGNKTILHKETKFMNNGMKATIITYRNAVDVDIKFEDGTIVTHKQYSNFKTGGIKWPTHIGEIRLINGQYAEIIEYRNLNDIDIRFEDGTIVNHEKYSNFKNNNIKSQVEVEGISNELSDTINSDKIDNVLDTPLLDIDIIKKQ